MNTFQVLINSSRLPEALALVHVACAVYDSCFPLLQKIVFLKALYLLTTSVGTSRNVPTVWRLLSLLGLTVRASCPEWSEALSSNIQCDKHKKQGHLLKSATELDTMLTLCVEWQSDIHLIPEGHVWEPLCHCGWSSCSFLQALATSQAIGSPNKITSEDVSQGADLDGRFGKGKPGAEVTKETAYP